MHDFEIKPELYKKLIKISRKDMNLSESVNKKIMEIISTTDLNHYKNLRYDMKNSKRVHVGHFVLVFSFDESLNRVIFEDLDHHDNIYEK